MNTNLKRQCRLGERKETTQYDYIKRKKKLWGGSE